MKTIVAQESSCGRRETINSEIKVCGSDTSQNSQLCGRGRRIQGWWAGGHGPDRSKGSGWKAVLWQTMEVGTLFYPSAYSDWSGWRSNSGREACHLYGAVTARTVRTGQEGRQRWKYQRWSAGSMCRSWVTAALQEARVIFAWGLSVVMVVYQTHVSRGPWIVFW